MQGIRTEGGIWSRSDLAGYRVVEREPIRADYHGIRIVTAPPPSSGGIVLAEALNILEGYHQLDRFDAPTRKHVIVEALRRAYQDRAKHLGDADFVAVPVERLLSDSYARARRRGIDLENATPSHYLPTKSVSGSGNTTHFSIIDCEGNRVAATLTINFLFGSGYMVPGMGVPTRLTRRYGNMQAIFVDITAHAVHAASDPRGERTARVLSHGLCTLVQASNPR